MLFTTLSDMATVKVYKTVKDHRFAAKTLRSKPSIHLSTCPPIYLLILIFSFKSLKVVFWSETRLNYNTTNRFLK